MTPERKPVKKQQTKSIIANAAENAAASVEEKQETKAAALPRRRRRAVREQVSTRILVEIRDAADDYMDDHGTTFQALVEIALTEYLEKSGYTVGTGR